MNFNFAVPEGTLHIEHINSLLLTGTTLNEYNMQLLIQLLQCEQFLKDHYHKLSESAKLQLQSLLSNGKITENATNDLTSKKRKFEIEVEASHKLAKRNIDEESLGSNDLTSKSSSNDFDDSGIDSDNNELSAHEVLVQLAGNSSSSKYKTEETTDEFDSPESLLSAACALAAFHKVRSNSMVQETKSSEDDLSVDESRCSSMTSNICKIEGCGALVESAVHGASASASTMYCTAHRSSRRCQKDGCNKCAQGATKFCIAHGGGRRCTFPGCFKGARDKFFCAAHGGGKRCTFTGCSKSAVGGSQLCTAHGGGKRCQFPDCTKSSQSNTNFCVRHGGGRSCTHPGCTKVARGKTVFCAAHGGGVRCSYTNCTKSAIGVLKLCRMHSTLVTQQQKTPSNGLSQEPFEDSCASNL